jgi:hypothetical protein
LGTPAAVRVGVTRWSSQSGRRERADRMVIGPYLEYTIVPVMDMMESIPTVNEGVEFRDSIK